MSVSGSTWQTNLYAIVAHPGEPCILLLPSADGWMLPVVSLADRIWAPVVEQANPALRAVLGVDCTVLRCAGVTVDRELQRITIVYVLEIHNPHWTPTDGRWIGREALADLPLAVPEHRTLLAEYLAECAGGDISHLRPPWAKLGWLAKAQSWITAQLVQRGYELIGPIEQVKCWGISCVLRSRTSSGDVYFKVSAKVPLFADEPRLMEALAAIHPDVLPTPIAIDREQGWMLLPDVGVELRGNSNTTGWETALRLHAQIQRSFVGQEPTLKAIGCLERRLDRLSEQIELLLDDVEELPGPDADALEQFRALAPRLQTMCRDLASMRVPYTLVHGDLHGGNIALRDGRYVFFDWTDGCIAHPFFDLATMLYEASVTLDEQECRSLRDMYLSQWTDYAPMDHLLEAWRLAQPLGALHQVVSYYYIVKWLEPASKHELVSGIKFWMQQVLQSMPGKGTG
jgi:hypothetical protein